MTLTAHLRAGLVLLACLLPGMAWAEAQTLESAINEAGRQRMLSQRLVLKYNQIGLGVFAEDAQRDLDNAVLLFSDQLARLQQFGDAPQLQEELAWVETLWRRMQRLLEGKVSREQMLRINRLSEELLYSTNLITHWLEAQDSHDINRLINLAGRQRMLSQRIAKYYMIRSWDTNTRSVDDQLEQARLEFERNLERLRTDPATSDEIRTELEQALVQWTWFQSVLEQHDSHVTFRLIVADAADSLLLMMDNITHLYEQMATEQRARSSN